MPLGRLKRGAIPTFRRDLPEDLQRAADEMLAAEAKRALDLVTDLDGRLTQHNFLANAGGAAAILAYMGTGDGAAFAIYPLALFLVGVTLSGLEVRALLKWFSAFHSDSSRRRIEFGGDRLALESLAPTEEIGVGHKRINHWAGVASQLCFPAGAIVGLWQYACAG